MELNSHHHLYISSSDTLCSDRFITEIVTNKKKLCEIGVKAHARVSVMVKIAQGDNNPGNKCPCHLVHCTGKQNAHNDNCLSRTNAR